jgi:hypothetical protein
MRSARAKRRAPARISARGPCAGSLARAPGPAYPSRMRAWALVLLLVSAGLATAGPTYRWVDEHGQVHYSDRAVPGAEEVELQGLTSYTPPAIDTVDVGSTPPPADAQAPAAPQSIMIVSPTPEQTLWNIGGRLPVAVQVQPALGDGQRINIYLDGNRVVDGEPGRLAFEIAEVWRGEHSLMAAVESADGTEILRSETIRFYVQQTSIRPQRAP